MSFTFSQAKRENVSIFISLSGASGSGKTWSALALARGLSPNGKIAFIDTENRRGLHYADAFSFIHAEMNPPFHPARFVEAIQSAEAAGAEVVIIDSFSHEYSGQGGICDMADELLEKGMKSPGNWLAPKQAHKKLMNALLQCKASIIFCLRADERIEIVRENGKTLVKQLGWMPITERRFIYEMVVSFTLAPDAPGRVNYKLPHKIQDQLRHFFPDGQLITEEAGKQLKAWASGGAPAPTPEKTVAKPDAHEIADLITTGKDKAKTEGMVELGRWWKELTAEQRTAIGVDSLAEMKELAMATAGGEA